MYLNIQYSSFESSFYYFSLFHLYIFTSLYLFIFSTFFFPPPTPLLRNKLKICIFIPVQGLRFGQGRTHRLANGTSQPCRSIACFRNVMPDISSVYLPQLHVVSPTGKKARHHGCRDSGVSKGHLLRLWLKPFRIQFFLVFPSYATPVTLPPPVLHSSATLILQRTCLLPLFRETTVIDSYAPFSLMLLLLLLIHAASTAVRSCTVPPPIHYRKTASKSTLAVSSNRSEHHALHRCEPQSFQMNFRRSQIIFPWCKVMEQLPLFSESVGERFANTGSAYLRQNLPFSDLTKRVFRDKLSAAILSNKKFKNLPFSASTKRVFVHFFMATTESVPY